MAYIGKTPASAALTSSDISDGIISTAKIADDAATADKIANAVNSAITANTAKTGISSAQTSAITANTSKTTNATHSGEVTGSGALTIAGNVVDEANLKVSNSPTNGYVLSAQSGNTGGLTWVEAGGGDFVKLATTTLGSDAATITFSSSLITTTYDNYFITGYMLGTTDNRFVESRVQTGGSIQTGSDYQYAIGSFNSSDYGSSQGDALWRMHRSGCGNATGEGAAFNMWFQNPMVSSIPTTFTATFSTRNDNGLFIGSASSGWYKVIEANNGILFFFSGGNVASGSTLSLYGITK